MAKPLKVSDDRPSCKWANSHGEYLTGRAYIDGADETASEMESKWGVGRLRLLVSPELRERFDRQRYLFNQAIWHGDLEAVRRESARMVKAWMALDGAAEAAGKEILPSVVWELVLADGSVAALVPHAAYAGFVKPEGRQVAVYTFEEIGRLLSSYPEIAKAKLAFPGTTITDIRRSAVHGPDDPLDAIWDSKAALDDEIPDLTMKGLA